MKPRYMLDTNICIYIAKQRPPQVRARFERLRPGQLVMSAITHGELSYGARKSNQSSKALAQLEELIQDVPVTDLDSSAGQAYGEIRARLEQQGCPIGNNDLWIAACAVRHSIPLVSHNRSHFAGIPDLVLKSEA